jgi:ribosomal protein L44E
MSVPIRVKRIRPGDDIQTYCGRCKAERTHQVVALKADGAPATVICRTCGGQHRFRKEKEAASSSSSSSSRAARKSSRKAEPLGEAPAGALRPYSPRETFAAGEWLDHPKFGQGKVTEARGGKIEVRFESGPRLLLHGG